MSVPEGYFLVPIEQHNHNSTLSVCFYLSPDRKTFCIVEKNNDEVVQVTRDISVMAIEPLYYALEDLRHFIKHGRV